MTHALRLAASLCLAAGLAGCDSIGEGSAIAKIDLVVFPVEGLEQGVMVDVGTATERHYMYDCFCANVTALATFTDGSLADFSARVEFTSDNPAVVDVLNGVEVDLEVCPPAQNGGGMVIPRGLGQATITARFGPLSDTLRIEVADAAAGTYVLGAAPPVDPGNTDVAVGGELPLRLTGTLDGRPRVLNRNVQSWSFDDDEDGDFASVDALGVVRGVAPTGASPKTARIAFGTCTDVSPTVLVNVGDVLGPLTLEREAPDFATDGMLATNSDEELVATAALDFDGDGVADGTQLVSQLIGLNYTDACELREFDATVPTTNCRLTNTTCARDVAVCTSGNLQGCPATMTPCRTLGSPIVRGDFANQIVAFNDNGAPTSLTATFPGDRGVPTTLAAPVDGAVTTIEVEELEGYPLSFPWFAVIDAAGVREDVRVTAADDTTLTVVRGVGGTAAVAHAAGATFEQRSYSSAPVLPIRGKEGTLTVVAIDPPGTLNPLGTLQLRAEGTFVDGASASRQQRVTRLIPPTQRADEAPEVEWTSSGTAIATVSANNGLMVSQTACGGRVTVRARASSSTDETTATFDPDSTADDDACLNTDPLCDQVEVCIATQSPLPIGTTCTTTTTCP